MFIHIQIYTYIQYSTIYYIQGSPSLPLSLSLHMSD